MALVLKHQTKEEFIGRLRLAYFGSDNGRTVQISRFILSRIQVGDLTDEECRQAWDMSIGQWNSLKNGKMQPLVNADAVVRGAIGE